MYDLKMGRIYYVRPSDFISSSIIQIISTQKDFALSKILYSDTWLHEVDEIVRVYPDDISSIREIDKFTSACFGLLSNE